MLSYILRRSAYSILVILGVMLLTFVLFLTVTFTAGGFLWLLSEYGMSEDLKAMLVRP